MDPATTTKEEQLRGKTVLPRVVKTEKTVTTSLLGHFRKYYNLKEAIEIQEECNE